MVSEQIYKKYLIANNNLKNELHAIAVIRLIQQALGWEYYLSDQEDRMTNMLDLFLNKFLFYSVKKTLNTDISSWFLFVVSNLNYSEAREYLTNFFANSFLSHEKAACCEYYFHIPGPKLASTPPPGGVIQHCIYKLVAELLEQEVLTGPLSDKPKEVWQTRTAHIHLDLDNNEEFPAMETNAKYKRSTKAMETHNLWPKRAWLPKAECLQT
jgi:hypothetical protein